MDNNQNDECSDHKKIQIDHIVNIFLSEIVTKKSGFKINCSTKKNRKNIFCPCRRLSIGVFE